MSRKSPNLEKLVPAARALLDWVYIFGLPGTPESRETFAALLNELDEAAGAREHAPKITDRVGVEEDRPAL